MGFYFSFLYEIYYFLQLSETMHSWKLKFGSTYRKLEHGYNYLRQVKRASFNDIEGRSELERRREEEKTLKMNNIWKERVKKIRQEMDDHHSGKLFL